MTSTDPREHVPDPLPDANQKVVARVLARLSVSPDLVGPDGLPCLLWDNPRGNGYGDLWVDGRHQLAHRVAHQLFVGPIPEGHVVDHLCHAQNGRASRACCRPSHLRAATVRENTIAAVGVDFCPRCDLPIEGDNLYVEKPTKRSPHGRRRCLNCKRRRRREAYARRKAGELPPAQRTRLERFEALVGEPTETGCTLWTGATYGGDCGSFRWSPEERSVTAYVAAYRLYYLDGGPIPEGMVVDHVASRGCVSRLCVNPDHLELVTQRENARRGRNFKGTSEHWASEDTCGHGHPVAKHGYTDTHGARRCRECRNEASRRSRRAKRKALGEVGQA